MGVNFTWGFAFLWTAFVEYELAAWSACWNDRVRNVSKWSDVIVDDTLLSTYCTPTKHILKSSGMKCLSFGPTAAREDCSANEGFKWVRSCGHWYAKNFRSVVKAAYPLTGALLLISHSSADRVSDVRDLPPQSTSLRLCHWRVWVGPRRTVKLSVQGNSQATWQDSSETRRRSWRDLWAAKRCPTRRVSVVGDLSAPSQNL